MRFRARRVAALLAIGMALTTVTACGSEVEASGEPAVQPTTVADVRSLTLPLDPYRPDRKQERQIEYGRMLIALKCLQRFGYTIAATAMPQPFPMTVNERRYGITDETEAAVYGYRPPFEAEKPEEPAVTGVALSILNGKDVSGVDVPEGGCRGEADRELADGADPEAVDWDLAQTLSITSLKESRADSRVQAAFGAWSTCMKTAGYDYPDPDAVDGESFMSAATVTETEIKLATADVKCKKETGLIDTWVAVESAYQNRAIAGNEQNLTALRTQLETRIRVAASVIGGKA
ncbi:hypothetical protein [Actinoplanes sp. NBRC 101535]|uniref:hypothetical protein n=1 Tax=Actinoplanes sp. NBRC 101535 TaxID=3032196 RepID=UPI0024A5ADFE|nr:hypothetical protein [Actinoplanes sp. NBRC 101535]GLY01197.1 hypothetical protein Acsp01_15760 [Actinoplanes sp. NBRC 101535]